MSSQWHGADGSTTKPIAVAMEPLGGKPLASIKQLRPPCSYPLPPPRSRIQTVEVDDSQLGYFSAYSMFPVALLSSSSKYRIVFLRPSLSGVCGFHPSLSCAFEMSGRR
jgi:hypothetical protein